MKANKRVRSLDRRSARRLISIVEGHAIGTTTYPLTAKDKSGKQHRRANLIIGRR